MLQKQTLKKVNLTQESCLEETLSQRLDTETHTHAHIQNPLLYLITIKKKQASNQVDYFPSPDKLFWAF